MAAPDSSPVLARKILAKRLRELRLTAGWTSAEEVAAGLGWSGTKITRWEQGNLTLPKPADIERLLTHYQATSDQCDEVLTLVQQAREIGWWRPYRDVIPPVYEALIGIESAATSLRVFEVHAVPDLFTTEAYGRAAIAGRYGRHDEKVERLLEVRQRRQERLFGDDPLTVWAIVEEAALRRPVAEPATMRDQLGRLLELANIGTVHLQVLPAAVGAHPAVAPFTVADFGGFTDEEVFAPTPSGGAIITSHDEIVTFRRVFEALIPLALSVKASKNFVEKLLSDL